MIIKVTVVRFRVTAYNDAGPSEPGDPSDPVVIDEAAELSLSFTMTIGPTFLHLQRARMVMMFPGNPHTKNRMQQLNAMVNIQSG